MKWMLSIVLVASMLALPCAWAGAQGIGALDGKWEGPWYRGMTSGRATLELGSGDGTLQLTNSETFGAQPRPVAKIVIDRDTVRLRVIAESGAPLTVDLRLNAEGDRMKGMGKYEGFSVRLELRRSAE